VRSVRPPFFLFLSRFGFFSSYTPDQFPMLTPIFTPALLRTRSSRSQSVDKLSPIRFRLRNPSAHTMPFELRHLRRRLSSPRTGHRPILRYPSNYICRRQLILLLALQPAPPLHRYLDGLFPWEITPFVRTLVRQQTAITSTPTFLHVSL